MFFKRQENFGLCIYKDKPFLLTRTFTKRYESAMKKK